MPRMYANQRENNGAVCHEAREEAEFLEHALVGLLCPYLGERRWLAVPGCSMRRCRGSSLHLARKRGRAAHMRRGQGERNDPGERSRTPRTPPRMRSYLGERRWLAVPGRSMRRCRGTSVHLARKRGREAHMRRGQGERNDPRDRSRTLRTPQRRRPYLGERRWLAVTLI